MKTGEWLLGARPSMPPRLHAARRRRACRRRSPQIPFNQFIRATGERDSILKPITDNWGPRAGVAWQLNPRTVLRSGYALMWDSMVSRSQYGQHQFETWGWPQFSGIDTGTINTESGPIMRIEDCQSAAVRARRARRRGTATASSTIPIARTPTRISGTSSCSGRSRAT